MTWKDWFRKKPARPDPIADLTLDKLKPGYFVDYDMKTWKVEAAHHYDWGDGDVTYEWLLQSADDAIFLEMESDDEDCWCISRKIDFSRLGPGIKEHVMAHGDPPETLTFEGVAFHLEEFGGGHFFKDRRGPGQPMLNWSYAGDDERQLTVEQWGESEFEASVGMRVEAYEFTNILPGEKL